VEFRFLNVTEHEMIKDIESIYNIMFVEAKGIQTLYKIDKYTGTPIASIISDYAWNTLPFSLTTDNKSVDMNENTTEMVQNTEIDPDYFSFIFDEDSQGNKIGLTFMNTTYTTSSSEEDEFDLHFMETR